MALQLEKPYKHTTSRDAKYHQTTTSKNCLSFSLGVVNNTLTLRVRNLSPQALLLLRYYFSTPWCTFVAFGMYLEWGSKEVSSQASADSARGSMCSGIDLGNIKRIKIVS